LRDDEIEPVRFEPLRFGRAGCARPEAMPSFFEFTLSPSSARCAVKTAGLISCDRGELRLEIGA
jgi:hypothetical protein